MLALHILHNPASKEGQGRKDRKESHGKKEREREEGMHREAGGGQSNMPALHVLHNLGCQHMSYIM